MWVLFVGGLVISRWGPTCSRAGAQAAAAGAEGRRADRGAHPECPRAGADTRDEVQSLAQALNRMLGRLEDSFEAQRRFTSDASHELRTPVTAISGHASYLLRRTSPSEGQRESLNIIRSEAERLTNLIAACCNSPAPTAG